MIQINLLPKDYLKGSSGLALGKVGLYSVIGAVGIAAMLVGLTLYQSRQVSRLEENIARANERAAMLERDIRLVDALIDVKEKINNRMSAVERLDRHRSVWVRILSDMSVDVPEFVWLGSFREKPLEAPKPAANQAGNAPNPESSQAPTTPGQPENAPMIRSAEIEGYAFTLNSLAAFMIALMRSDYFDKVELVSSKETIFNGDDKAYNFVVSCDVHYLTDEQLRTAVAQTPTEESFNEADYEEAAPPAEKINFSESRN